MTASWCAGNQQGWFTTGFSTEHTQHWKPLLLAFSSYLKASRKDPGNVSLHVPNPTQLELRQPASVVLKC